MLHAGSLHASQLPLSGNQQAFRIVEEQPVINILGWSVGRYHRTRGIGGDHLDGISFLSPQIVWVRVCTSFLHLSVSPVIYLPSLLPSFGPGLLSPSCSSGLQLPLRLSLLCVFSLPVSPPGICLPLSLRVF